MCDFFRWKELPLLVSFEISSRTIDKVLDGVYFYNYVGSMLILIIWGVSEKDLENVKF